MAKTQNSQDTTTKKLPRFKLYTISSQYIQPIEKKYKLKYSTGIKSSRPYTGVVFSIDGRDYFAPLGTPKSRHFKMKNKPDFHKITITEKKKKKLIAFIDFNKMIPVPKSQLSLIDIEKKKISNPSKADRLNKEIKYINRHRHQLAEKAELLYQKYKDNSLNKRTRKRCVDFIKMDKYYDQWIAKEKANIQTVPNTIQKTVNSKQAPATKAPFKLSTKSNQTNKDKGHSR